MKGADGVVIGLAAGLIGWLYAALWQAPTAANWVEIRSGQAPAQRYALTQDRQIEINGRLGVSQLEIRGGRVHFLRSPCRNQVCVHSGWLSHSGELATCLPNRISILLGGGDAAYDAVSF